MGIFTPFLLEGLRKETQGKHHLQPAGNLFYLRVLQQVPTWSNLRVLLIVTSQKHGKIIQDVSDDIHMLGLLYMDDEAFSPATRNWMGIYWDFEKNGTCGLIKSLTNRKGKGIIKPNIQTISNEISVETTRSGIHIGSWSIPQKRIGLHSNTQQSGFQRSRVPRCWSEGVPLRYRLEGPGMGLSRNGGLGRSFNLQV